VELVTVNRVYETITLRQVDALSLCDFPRVTNHTSAHKLSLNRLANLTTIKRSRRKTSSAFCLELDSIIGYALMTQEKLVVQMTANFTVYY